MTQPNHFKPSMCRPSPNAVILLFFILCTLPSEAAALPPPDFVVNAGLQLVHVFGIVAFACSTAGSFLYKKYSLMLNSPAKRTIALISIIGGFALACYLSLA